MSNVTPYNPGTNLPSTAVEAAVEFAAQSYSDNTLRAYEAQLALWSKWAATNSQSAIPADPAAVAVWLSERAKEGSSRSTIKGALAALRWAHGMKGLPFDAHSPALKHAVRGIMRAATTARVVKQAKPLKPTMLRDILTRSRTPHERRDACVVAMLYSFALRRSELAALDYQTNGDGLGILEISGSTATVTLLRSKSSQEHAARVSIERDTNPSAFAAIEAWVQRGKIEIGTPVIRGINPAGTVSTRRLHPNRISDAVKAAVERHLIREGTEPALARQLADEYSGHSGRVGLVVTSVEAGASDSSIMGVTRHKSPVMVARYGKDARAGMASPNKLKGVGV